MSAQSVEQDRPTPPEGVGCKLCGNGPDKVIEELVEHDGAWAHPLCVEAETEAITEATQEAKGKVIELRSKRGSLTIEPGQSELTGAQRAALVAINIDTVNDPGVIPHIRPFFHMCDIRGLDPFAKEAYLIGRGKGDKRKWTYQTGIDGYRKMAASTGRMIRVKKTLWTGKDDDDRSWRETVDEDGDLVMRRVWFDQWPEGRGEPGAARVVIEHYDESGSKVTTTDGVADWSMFAPYVDEWENVPGGGRRPKRGPDGKPVRTLTDMWAKGAAFMLAKCAEALAYRKAFPNTMNGFYITEEMHRADAEERARVAEEQRDRRASAYRAATSGRSAQQQLAAPTGAPSAAEPAPVPVGETAQEVVDALRDGAPEQDGAAPNGAGERATVAPDSAPSAAPEAAPSAPLTEADLVRLARREHDWMADVLGAGWSVERMARRGVESLRKPYKAFTSAELLRLANGYRSMVLGKLRQAGEQEIAARYADVPADQIADIDGDILDVVEGELMPEDDERLDADPTQPHAPVMVGGLCEVCGEEFDNVLHPEE